MRFGQNTILFGDEKIATAVPGRSRYAHTFGGPSDREGASRDDCQGIHIHLLHRLDLTDPKIPISIPGIRWLPIYYCFDFRANTLGCQLLGEDSMAAFFPQDDPNVSEREEWPDENFPMEFPKSRIKIERLEYDPTNREDAVRWAGVFGIGKLSKSDQERVKAQIIQESEKLGYNRLPETEEEFAEELASPFLQGKPNDPCLNPRCSFHKNLGGLMPIALMPAEPVKGVHVFGRWGTGVELIVQMCRECHTIHVGNQCT